MLLLMQELSGLLRERRKARGAIDFDFPECKIVLDERGRTLDIRPYERNAATRLIEDFMLDIMYEIPKDDSIGEVVITKDYVEHTGGPKILLRGQEVPKIGSGS